MAQYVYTMQGVSKIVPPKRTILENIHLSFFPGAKIGVLGLNGAGKSTLLKIMAGLDTEIEGEARPQKDINVGYLPQEPQLDDDLDVRGNVEQGVAEITAILKEYNEISDKFAEPMDDEEMNQLLERQGEKLTEQKIEAEQGKAALAKFKEEQAAKDAEQRAVVDDLKNALGENQNAGGLDFLNIFGDDTSNAANASFKSDIFDNTVNNTSEFSAPPTDQALLNNQDFDPSRPPTSDELATSNSDSLDIDFFKTDENGDTDFNTDFDTGGLNTDFLK